MDKQLQGQMTFRKSGRTQTPMAVFEVNGSYIVGVYRGTLSKFDILVKYRQKKNGVWSRIRTPKHIHWAVDILIKLHEDRAKTQKFLSFLLGMWRNTCPVKNRRQQKSVLSIEALLKDSKKMIRQSKTLSCKGEYSVKFLILLAKLLMVQEKTNLATAYMFKKLLESLLAGGDIFSVVSIASHNRR